jgi:hypothetical protein
MDELDAVIEGGKLNLLSCQFTGANRFVGPELWLTKIHFESPTAERRHVLCVGDSELAGIEPTPGRAG